jgi:hypothetical protein
MSFGIKLHVWADFACVTLLDLLSERIRKRITRRDNDQRPIAE